MPARGDSRSEHRLALSLLGQAPVAWPHLPGWPEAVQRAWAPRLARAADDARLPGQLLGLLRAAVRRLRPAHGAACSLSGGLDSAILAALLAELGPTRAFTLVDDFGGPHEWRQAAALARRCGLEHVGVRVSQEQLPDRFADAVRACRAPIWNGKGVAALLYFEGARQAGARTLLSGCGADELLCGNPGALASFERRLRRECALSTSLLTPPARAALPRRAVRARPAGVPSLAWRQWLYLRTVLPASTLPIEVGLGAAAGLELRLPYLDPALARLAARLPMRQRVRAGVGKWALRSGSAGLVADHVRWAAKTARLAPPGGSSARARARWRALLHELLAPARLAQLGFVRTERVGALLESQRDALPVSEQAAVGDAVLMRLASLVVLAG